MSVIRPEMLVVGIGCLLLAALPFVASSYLVYLAFTFLLFYSMGSAWNLMAGYCGLVSVGNQLFVGLSGYIVALVTYYAGWPVWVALLISGSACGIIAFVIGWTSNRNNLLVTRLVFASIIGVWFLYDIWIHWHSADDIFASAYVRNLCFLLLGFLWLIPMLRLEGAYFAIATWLIAACVETIFAQWDIVGAGNGIRIPITQTLGGLFYLALLLAFATSVVLYYLLSGKWGLALTAIRDDANAAQSSGISVDVVKLGIFCLGAAITGLAGGLYFTNVGLVTSSAAFDVVWTAYFIFIVVTGGMGTFWGPAVGALLYVFFTNVTAGSGEIQMIVLGTVSIAIVIVAPHGIVGALNNRFFRAPSAARKTEISSA